MKYLTLPQYLAKFIRYRKDFFFFFLNLSFQRKRYLSKVVKFKVILCFYEGFFFVCFFLSLYLPIKCLLEMVSLSVLFNLKIILSNVRPNGNNLGGFLELFWLFFFQYIFLYYIYIYSISLFASFIFCSLCFIFVIFIFKMIFVFWKICGDLVIKCFFVFFLVFVLFLSLVSTQLNKAFFLYTKRKSLHCNLVTLPGSICCFYNFFFFFICCILSFSLVIIISTGTNDFGSVELRLPTAIIHYIHIIWKILQGKIIYNMME